MQTVTVQGQQYHMDQNGQFYAIETQRSGQNNKPYREPDDVNDMTFSPRHGLQKDLNEMTFSPRAG